MICPTCSAKTHLIMALTSDRCLPSREPNVFVQYRCEQGHYFITLKVFDGTIYQEHYLTADQRNPDVKASFN
jgi:hypothetical protein